MRFLFISLLISTISFSQSNNVKKEFKKIIADTKSVMRELKIEIRKNINRDDILLMKVDSTYPPFNSNFTADIDTTMGSKFITYHYDLRQYNNPCIFVSPLLVPIIKKQIDTTNLIHIKAVSCLVHELTHYFQVTSDSSYTEPTNDSMMKEYMYRPTEFEAFTVQAYFFLKKYDSEKLKKILKSTNPTRGQRELLINTFYEYTTPWRSKPF